MVRCIADLPRVEAPVDEVLAPFFFGAILCSRSLINANRGGPSAAHLCWPAFAEGLTWTRLEVCNGERRLAKMLLDREQSDFVVKDVRYQSRVVVVDEHTFR